MKIDLHVHTTFSDGENTPLQILDLCKKEEVNVVAITDHNNITGAKEAILKNPYKDVKVISGVEFSATYDIPGGSLHILGYNIDLKNNELNSVLDAIMEDSYVRMASLLYQLKQNYGFIFNSHDLALMFAKPGNVGRPEVAKLCVKYGYAVSVQDAFERLLEPIHHKLVKKKVRLSGKECIRYILNAGGVACLAHPVYLNKDITETKEYIKELMEYGLEAIEVYYSEHSPEYTREMLKLVKDFNLLYSVGSDYHGPIVKPEIKIGRGVKDNLNLESATILKKILRSD